jgi:hypothetical protein
MVSSEIEEPTTVEKVIQIQHLEDEAKDSETYPHNVGFRWNLHPLLFIDFAHLTGK